MDPSTRKTTPAGTGLGGLASAVAGLLLVPYALTKGTLTSSITAEGWHLPGLTAHWTATLFHVAETVPVVAFAVGLICLHRRTAPGGALPRLGVATALAGFGATVLTHLGEHLLPPFTVPALTGGENWFMWGYYLSWLVVFGGLAIYGVGLTRRGDRPRWIPALLMGGLPLALTVGLTVVATDLFTVAGTFRLLQGFTWAAVGGWLWRGPGHRRRSGRVATADS